MRDFRAARLRQLVTLLCACWISTAGADRPVAPERIPGATLLSAETLIEMLVGRDPPLLIDARLPQEYRNGHIEGAINITDNNLTQEKLGAHAASLDTPIAFYCNGERCLRSSNASNKAISWGYRNVYWFRGGWVEWTAKRYPVAW